METISHGRGVIPVSIIKRKANEQQKASRFWSATAKNRNFESPLLHLT